jgi:hypothetical protein
MWLAGCTAPACFAQAPAPTRMGSLRSDILITHHSTCRCSSMVDSLRPHDSYDHQEPRIFGGRLCTKFWRLGRRQEEEYSRPEDVSQPRRSMQMKVVSVRPIRQYGNSRGPQFVFKSTARNGRAPVQTIATNPTHHQSLVQKPEAQHHHRRRFPHHQHLHHQTREDLGVQTPW